MNIISKILATGNPEDGYYSDCIYKFELYYANYHCNPDSHLQTLELCPMKYGGWYPFKNVKGRILIQINKFDDIRITYNYNYTPPVKMFFKKLFGNA